MTPVWVVWEYTGPTDTCQMDQGCLDPAEFVVQAGQPTPWALPPIRRSCRHHVPKDTAV